MTSNAPTLRFFGGLLMAIGGLVAGLSGLCSLTFLGYAIWGLFAEGQRLADLGSMLLLILAFGGVPFALGAGVFAWGRRLRR